MITGKYVPTYDLEDKQQSQLYVKRTKYIRIIFKQERLNLCKH